MQSVFTRHCTQRLSVVEQIGAFCTAAQSGFMRHCTHAPVVVSHFLLRWLIVHCVSLVHFATQ